MNQTNPEYFHLVQQLVVDLLEKKALKLTTQASINRELIELLSALCTNAAHLIDALSHFDHSKKFNPYWLCTSFNLITKSVIELYQSHNKDKKHPLTIDDLKKMIEKIMDFTNKNLIDTIALEKPRRSRKS